MKIAIFSRKYRTEISLLLRKTIDFLQKSGVEVLIESDFFAKIAKNETDFPPISTFDSRDFSADFALSIGGDGTFLSVAHAVGSKNIPILGINAGRLGFLAAISDDEIMAALSDLISGNFCVVERAVLQISTSDKTVFQQPFALNEVAVLKQDLSSMIAIRATVDGEHLHTYMADGLIVATPTGSTAYALSVGGPLLLPTSKDLVLAPVASHSLTVRPMVIPDSCQIDLEVESRSHNYLVSLDGHSQPLAEGTSLHIAKADFTIKTVELNGHSFFTTLKNKLLWGVDQRLEMK